MDEREHLERHVGASAREHWATTLERLRDGEDLASKHEWRFLADDEAIRARMARAHYALAHVEKLAALPASELLSLMSPWLEEALDHALEDYVPAAECTRTQGESQEDFLTRLVRSQYVVLVDDDAKLHSTGPLVEGYPNPQVLYGDIYELSASGVSSGAVVYLCKATVQPFARWEIGPTFRGLRADFYGNAASADDEAWDFEWLNEGEDDRVIAVRVAERGGADEDEGDEDEEELVE